MAAKLRYAFILFVIASGFSSCCKDDEIVAPVSLGEIKSDLNANRSVVRTSEAVAGNLFADALKEYVESKGESVDFAIMNGGGIRFDAQIRPNGIFPAGYVTTEIVNELHPFGNIVSTVIVSGKEVRSIFERSAAQLPGQQGAFLQVSKEVKIIIDLSKQAQIIDLTQATPTIVTEGSRVISIKINDLEIDSTALYTIAAPDFIIDGNDGYVTFGNVLQERKKYFGEDLTVALSEYIILHTPVTLAIESRIIILP